MNENMTQPKKSFISIGTASFVLIFVLLCLLTFAVLSLVSARANLRLSQKSADRTTDYYAAENAANDILLTLDGIIDGCLEDESGRSLWDRVLAEAEMAGLDLTAEGDTLRYDVPLGENQTLAMELLLSETPFPNGKYYEITAWNTASGYDWSEDQPMNLFDPSALFGADSEEN